MYILYYTCMCNRKRFIYYFSAFWIPFVVCTSLINKNIKDVFLYVYPALESGGETTT